METLTKISPFSPWQIILLIAIFVLFSISVTTCLLLGFWSSISPKSRRLILSISSYAFLTAISCAYLGFTTLSALSLNLIKGTELATIYWIAFTFSGAYLVYSELATPLNNTKKKPHLNFILKQSASLTIFMVGFAIAIISLATGIPS